MKLCASTLALPPGPQLDLLSELVPLGLDGIEVAPAWTWVEPNRVTSAEVAAYRRTAEGAGLRIVGLHALLTGEPGVGLFAEGEALDRTLELLLHRSALCRDLGGRTLILDAGFPLDPPEPERWRIGRRVLEHLLPRIERHGTVLCLAPRGAGIEGIRVTAKNLYLLVNAIEHPALGLHLGAAALMENGEMGHATFAAVRGRLDHVHIDEPDLAPIGASGRIDHVDLRRHLAAISYFGWISILQKRVTGRALSALADSAAFVSRRYLPVDTR